MSAEIVQFQQREAAKFECSACGADRGCACNAPAVEKLAAKLEQDRKRQKARRERKAEEKQSTRHVTEGSSAPEPIATEAAEPASAPNLNYQEFRRFEDATRGILNASRRLVDAPIPSTLNEEEFHETIGDLKIALENIIAFELRLKAIKGAAIDQDAAS